MAEATRRQTTVGEPVHLPQPAPPVDPTPGCDVCAALDRQRTQAVADGDHSRATDYTVEIGRHPHQRRR